MITIKVRGAKELERWLNSLPRGSKKVALPAYGEYLIGDGNHGLSHYPPRVEHGADNPYKWESERQRRAYFATNGFGGGIPYRRTGALGVSWIFETPGWDVWKGRIVNKVPYARYVMGDAQQKGHRADKWRKVEKVVKDNVRGALRAAQAAVNRWARTK